MVLQRVAGLSPWVALVLASRLVDGRAGAEPDARLAAGAILLALPVASAALVWHPAGGLTSRGLPRAVR